MLKALLPLPHHNGTGAIRWWGVITAWFRICKTTLSILYIHTLVCILYFTHLDAFCTLVSLVEIIVGDHTSKRWCSQVSHEVLESVATNQGGWEGISGIVSVS